MGNAIVLVLIILILSLSIGKIVKEKKKGVKCIGCPYNKECSSHSCGIEIKK
ncbi:MAG: FeoB-associated Cys-rich membrane protein [Clostridium sp.]